MLQQRSLPFSFCGRMPYRAWRRKINSFKTVCILVKTVLIWVQQQAWWQWHHCTIIASRGGHVTSLTKMQPLSDVTLGLKCERLRKHKKTRILENMLFIMKFIVLANFLIFVTSLRLHSESLKDNSRTEIKKECLLPLNIFYKFENCTTFWKLLCRIFF